jgi:beta-mannanase
MNTIRARGAIPMVDWGSWNSSAVGASQTAFSLRNIANGATVGYGGETFDQYVTQWAQAAKAWGHPFFLRFDWEMNGNWQFPWSAQLNGNTPADFIAAWRHVHDIFTRVGATNVTWVWCPNVHSSNTVPMALVYPGDAYVDWVALDAYNKAPKLWLSFAQLVAGGAWNGNLNSYHEITSLAPNKPLMIGEIASLEAGDGGAKKAAWIQDALGTQISTNFPAIKAVVWFNWNADANSSYVIESSAMAQAAFKQALAQPAYTTNSYANTTASPIPPAS